ncbi:amino acid permease [Bordetella ansorpii]|uniref:Amino acid permease n=1 Tax=Bordetella ansorpii TaxID=288768 RepID=A0A157S9H8_9BORD|nr:APC family permease [Bordetella ansorpii]SAI67082.1 amino acid permease [Bordetella ansorpii]
MTAAATTTTTTADRSHGMSVTDGVGVLVGVVMGIGIFGFPPLVAQNAGSVPMYIAMWLAGGAVMLIGALCYAELGSAYPDSGGEYHYLTRAWGPRVAMLFGWARGTVIQTGAIATVAFIYGEYAQQLLPLGTHGVTIHAVISVVVLTLLNMIGTSPSKRLQLLLTGLEVASLAAIVVAGVMSLGTEMPPPPPPMPIETSLAGALGMGMVFVLLTYGGWNEAAYLCGELRNPARDVVRVMLIGTAIVVSAYLLVNLALLQIFGLGGLQRTQAVGSEVMQLVAGPYAAVLLAMTVSWGALTTINGTILTGGRVYHALGRDLPGLRKLSGWSERGQSPTNGLLVQGVLTLALVAVGHFAENSVQALVAYTAPVFWLFMMLVALALIKLRQREPSQPRPFKVPLYPLTPILLALTCAGLVWSSSVYAGVGSLLGLAVLALGVPALYFLRRGHAPA